MLWPLESAVHSRDVEQRLLYLDNQVFRMQQDVFTFPLGYAATANSFPLPPEPEDDCTTECIDGTPTIPLGSGNAFRRHSILGANATGIVYLDWDGSAWISGTIPLITPLVCSGQSVNLRWKMTATGIGVGEVTLILQYQVPIVGPTWNNGPTWLSTKVWDTRCGLSFKGGDDFDPGLSCNQSGPSEVCVNPVNLCEGEHSEFFAPSRVLSFVMAGAGGSVLSVPCSNFNRTWSMSRLTAYQWRQNVTASGSTYTAEAFAPGFFGSPYLTVSLSATLTGPLAVYRAPKCDVLIPGVTRLAQVSAGGCTGWPSFIDVTCT